MSRRRALQLVALALVAGATWLGVKAYLAASHLSEARRELDQVRSHLIQRDLTRTQSELDRAARDTASARAATRSWVWRATSHVPVVGRSFRSVSIVADAAYDVTHSALPSALTAAKRLDPDRVRGADGTIDIAYLRTIAPDLDRAIASSTAAHALGEKAPDSLLLPFVGRARSSFLSSSGKLTSGLKAARQAVDLAPALLGQDRPRRYFVAVQQNAESRGTGGLIGGYAILLADHGQLTVERHGSNQELAADGSDVAVPAGLPAGFVEAYKNYSIFDSWSNVNIPPDLPAVARLVAAKWQVKHRQSIDGVIALDGTALQDILAGTPPLKVGALTIKPEDLTSYLALGQYENVPLNAESLTRRKDSLEQVADAVLRRLTTDSKDNGLLLQGVVVAARSGHLRIASPDPQLAGLRDLRIDGALPSGPQPVAFPVMFNAQGSKLDQWVTRSVTWTCEDEGRARVSVRLSSIVPAGPIPPYIGLDLRSGDSFHATKTDAVHLDVYVTRGATLKTASKDGKQLEASALTAGSVDGLPFWGTDVELAPGSTHTFALELSGAATKGEIRIPEQPLIQPLVTRVESC